MTTPASKGYLDNIIIKTKKHNIFNLLKKKIIWYLFWTSVFFLTVNAFGEYHSLDFITRGFIRILVLFIPIFLLICHSFMHLSVKRGLIFISTAAFIGFVFEFIGLRNGTLFGGHYIYNPDKVAILGVPVSVVAYWALFTYLGYSIVNSYLYWLNKNKPNVVNNNFKLIPLLIIADGLIVVFIDLFMDPLQVSENAWTWLEGGPYFGIPLGNFAGWFAVTILITGIYRIFEYYIPQRKKPKVNSDALIPVMGYGALVLSFGFTSIIKGMYALTLIGSTLMLLVIISNITLYLLHYKQLNLFNQGFLNK